MELQLGDVEWLRDAQLWHQGPRLDGASPLCLQRIWLELGAWQGWVKGRG